MPTSRATVARLARAGRGGLIGVSRAAEALGLSSRQAAQKLGALARSGWLLRARRGLYLVLSLETEPGQRMVAEDAWILAKAAFSPCYIGGWSAAEHWGLTEQIFRSTLVITASHVRARSVRLLDQEFRLFRVPRARISGTTPVWRGSEQVLVSSRERTIIDCLRHPTLGGGIRHLVPMMREYGRSRQRDFTRLIAVSREAASGAAWKRLGYIAELLWPSEKPLLAAARMYLSAGNAKLDPAVRRRGTLARRWRLWINIPVAGEAEEP